MLPVQRQHVGKPPLRYMRTLGAKTKACSNVIGRTRKQKAYKFCIFPKTPENKFIENGQLVQTTRT